MYPITVLFNDQRLAAIAEDEGGKSKTGILMHLHAEKAKRGLE